jgi:hypothetical protein
MKTMLWGAAAALALLALPCDSAAQQTNAIEAIKQSYSKAVDRIDSDGQAAQKKLQDSYADAVDRAVLTLKKQGDPEPVQAALGELMRFQAEKTVPNPPAANLPPAVQGVQRQYLDATRRSEIQKARRLLECSKQFATQLDQLMRTFTAEDKLDLALAAKKEKERITALAARIEEQSRRLVELEARQTQQPVTSSPASDPPEKKPFVPMQLKRARSHP